MPITPQQAAAKGKGWADKNNPNYGTAGFVGAEDEDDYVAPSSGVAAPPIGGPMVANPDGTATHAPTASPTPAPAATASPEKVALPGLGPLAASPDGTATHKTEVSADGGPDPADPATPAAVVGAPPTTVNDAFKKALMDGLTKPIGVDPNDPAIKGQMDAFSLAQTRAKQRDREALAGRAAATGQLSDLSSGGAFNEGLSNLEQRQGEAESAFNADLVGDELTKQRDELSQWMAIAGNTLNAEEGRALTERLATMNAQIQREGMAQAERQWTQQFGLEGQKLAEMTRQFDLTTKAGQDALRQQLEMFRASQAEQGRQFDVDAELKKLGINTQGDLGRGDLDLRRFLGEGGMNLDLLQLLMGNDQFNKGEAGTNARFGAGLDADMWKALFGGLS